jgi:uncharacterized SAM-binding protein YcdF (DUF218 family)
VEWVRAVAKAIGGPGSRGFFLFVVVIGLLLMVPARSRKWGRRLVVALTVSYLVLSIPAVSHLLAAWAGAPDPRTETVAGKLDDLFVLDGDNYVARAAMAAKIAPATAPRTVWVLGGSRLKRAMLDAGIPDDPASWTGSARTTQQQVAQVGQFMKENNSRRAALIVSRLQAARTRGLVARLGLDVLVIPAPVDHEPPSSGVRRWLPSLAGLVLSRDALYEMGALAYYRRNGWI